MTTNPTSPRILLHAEGAAVLMGAVAFYRELGASWLVFVLLFLAPDLSMLGYLANQRTGAALYNTVHTYVLPVLVYLTGFAVGSSIFMALGLIWIAHIGVDRLLGFGLKYETAFRDTHFERC
jgi:Domain of unknown function (DUF4260)